MNQEKISKLIKELRKKNHLTQKEFSEMFGVTYQAVSKWENEKNIPDIDILKQICETYNLDINEFLKGNETVKKRQKWFIISIPIFLILILSIVIFYLLYTPSFEFKTLTTSCNNFTISGSIAYNAKKSSIYISHINYCGGNDTTKYQSISCSLYETHNNTKTKISEAEENKNLTLEEFLKDLTFYIDNYICEEITNHTFHLEIEAMEEIGKITSYKIPLDLEDNCSLNKLNP